MKSLKLLDIFFTVYKILFSLTMSMKFTDIDECSLATTPCDQECTNLNGSFQCTCRPGYSLKQDKTTCSSMTYWFFLVKVRLFSSPCYVGADAYS